MTGKTALALYFALLSFAVGAGAAEYPTKPIRLIVPAGPGSSNDTMVRVLALRLGEALGQQVVVDNRPGAGGIIGTETAVRSAPDGYTLLAVSTASVIFPQLHARLGFDPLKDLVPIVMFGVMQNTLVVNSSVPAKSVKDLVAMAKGQPRKLNMSSAGAGSQSHLAGVQFLLLAGIEAVHVPYRDGGASVAAAIGNEAQFTVTPLPAILAHVKAGRLRALGTGGDRRSPQLPEVPTIAEAGLPAYRSTGWAGLQAPRGTAAPVLAKLNATVVRVMSQPEPREQLARQGAEAATSTQGQFAVFIREEWDRYGPVIKAAGLKVE